MYFFSFSIIVALIVFSVLLIIFIKEDKKSAAYWRFLLLSLGAAFFLLSAFQLFSQGSLWKSGPLGLRRIDYVESANKIVGWVGGTIYNSGPIGVGILFIGMPSVPI